MQFRFFIFSRDGGGDLLLTEANLVPPHKEQQWTPAKNSEYSPETLQQPLKHLSSSLPVLADQLR